MELNLENERGRESYIDINLISWKSLEKVFHIFVLDEKTCCSENIFKNIQTPFP